MQTCVFVCIIEKTEKLERQLTEVSEKHRVELDKTQCANQQLQKDYSDNKGMQEHDHSITIVLGMSAVTICIYILSVMRKFINNLL